MSNRLTAGEVCSRIVTIAFRATPLNQAARLMREQHVGSLVVVEETDPGRVVVGMLTDRDIVVSVVARDMDARQMQTGEVMTTDVVTATEDDTVIDVLEQMRRRGVRRIPVIGAQGVLIGLVTLDDLLAIVAEEMQVMVGAISSGSRREHLAKPALAP